MRSGGLPVAGYDITRQMHDHRRTAFFTAAAKGFARALVFAFGLLGASDCCRGQSTSVEDSSKPNLLQFGLEDLGKIKVTSVSRKSEDLSTAPAAIYVVQPEDIRRSGVNSLPEIFRNVPGMEVAQANSHQWAITARGFNSVFANKLLVLMDGRALYTPAFSGVFWEEIDVVLEDLDRIEVIRGPGATLWGANAVNGVINIMTKPAGETQGLLVSAGGGLEERGFGTVRYGGRLGNFAHYRVYAKAFDRDEFTRTDGRGAGDDWWKAQTGFRVDWEPSEENTLTWQGDYYHGQLNGQVMRHSLSPVGVFPSPYRDKVEGVNVLGRWSHLLSDDSDFSVQAYFDRTDRGFGTGGEIRETIDFDAQHRFPLGSHQEVVWGAGYRFSADEFSGSADYEMADPKLGLQLFSAFLQDEIVLVRDRLHFTLGSKFEHNDFTGFEVQPSARVAWTPHDQHTVWAAVSRAVRTPSRTERSASLYLDAPIAVPFPIPLLVRGMGNPNFGSEELLAYELGYRVKAHDRLTLDGAVFYNEYDNLWAAVALPAEFRPLPEPHLFAPGTTRNDLFGESYGFEVAAIWQPLAAWRLRAGYTFFKLNLHTRGSVRSFTEDSEKDDPQQQVFLWSDTDLGWHWEWGLGVRYVDPRRTLGVSGYTALESRLAWKPTPNLEVALIGRNLLDPHQLEAAPLALSVKNVEVDRALYAKLTLRY